MVISVSLMVMMRATLCFGALLPFHKASSWNWTEASRRKSFVSRSRSRILPDRDELRLLLARRGGGDGGGNGDDQKKKQNFFYEPNTAGFGSDVMMGGFLSHIYVMSNNTDLDSILPVLKEYLPPSLRHNIISEVLPDYLQPISNIHEDEEEEKV